MHGSRIWLQKRWTWKRRHAYCQAARATGLHRFGLSAFLVSYDDSPSHSVCIAVEAWAEGLAPWAVLLSPLHTSSVFPREYHFERFGVWQIHCALAAKPWEFTVLLNFLCSVLYFGSIAIPWPCVLPIKWSPMSSFWHPSGMSCNRNNYTLYMKVA